MFLIGLVGCASAPSQQVMQAAEKYQTVQRSMSRTEVYRILGEPQKKLPDGRELWCAINGRDTAEFWLRFDAGGNITEMEKRFPMVVK